MTHALEQLLLEADGHVAGGDWGNAHQTLLSAIKLAPDHPGILNGLGTCLLQLDRVDDAIGWFTQVCEIVPDSPDAQGNLGVAYTFQGNLTEAERAFRAAVELDGEHRPSWKNLAQILLQQADRLQEGVEILAALVQSDTNDVEALLLLAQCYEQGGDRQSAQDIYEHVLQLEPSQQNALAALERLRPKDIHRIASRDHLNKLNALTSAAQSGDSQQRLLVMAAPVSLAATYRLEPAAAHLRSAGFQVRTTARLEETDIQEADIFLLHDPWKAEPFAPGVEACLQSGKPVILDFSSPLPFEELNGESRRWEEYSQKVKAVTGSSDVVVQSLAKHNLESSLLPACWSSANPLWEKTHPAPGGVRPGIVCEYSTASATQALAPMLKKLLEQHAAMTFTLIGPLQNASLLAGVPAERMLLLPPGDVDDFPFQLAQLDLLLLPGNEQPYITQAMLHAGIRGIPWIALRSPRTEEWASGGIMLADDGGWMEAIAALVVDPEKRRQLGEAGRKKAGEHHIHVVGASWEAILS